MVDKLQIPCGNKIIKIEKGKLATQSSGSAYLQLGDTIVLVTSVVSEEKREDIDFFPLICDYREQTSAAGKIPGGFFKREGKPSEREVLVSRLIDRSIRPLFPEDFYNDVQVISLVLSADQENNPDILSIIGTSVALTSSPIPFNGPIGAVRIGLIDGKYIVNPAIPELEKSLLNLVVAGTENSIIMLEGIASEISEEQFIEAVEIAWGEIKKMVDLQKPLTGEKMEIEKEEIKSEILTDAENFLIQRLKEAYNYPEKLERKKFYKNLEDEFLQRYEEDDKKQAEKGFEKVFKKQIRKLILETGRRLDGREIEQIRPIKCEVGLLPRTHGSALFTRGQTQCLSSVTLGTRGDEQIIDGLYEETTKRFMVHYNFPPFSVGEVSPLRAPSRREIGHGALAEKALTYIIPDEEKFPYTIRIVANILESNGSSSMATVCAGSLALMDAGVCIEKHVGGIALGMIKEGEKYIILTDIAGEEDHYGDLDFKVAGTFDGITACQMDVKAEGFNIDILKEALYRSKEARKIILEKMYATISSPRDKISPYAPKILSLKVNPEKIGLVIGTGGKTIKRIIEETGVKIDILDEGEIRIYSDDIKACEKAAEEIKKLTEEPEIGKIYDGTVVKTFPFGAVVRFLNSQEGLVHISELAPYRVKRVEDVVKIGSPVRVKFIGYDDQGRIILSRKQAISQSDKNSKKQVKPR